MYLSYPRSIPSVLKGRFFKLKERFVLYWNMKIDYELADWVNLLSDLLCEICYLHEFNWLEFPQLGEYCTRLSDYATQIQSTYKI